MAASLADEYNDEVNGDQTPRVDEALNGSEMADIIELLRI